MRQDPRLNQDGIKGWGRWTLRLPACRVDVDIDKDANRKPQVVKTVENYSAPEGVEGRDQVGWMSCPGQGPLLVGLAAA